MGGFGWLASSHRKYRNWEMVEGPVRIQLCDDNDMIKGLIVHLLEVGTWGSFGKHRICDQ